MSRERLFLFDTTLRDGQQTAGVDFSADDKTRIAKALDDLGIDYVEGGWPGANPTDSDFFDNAPTLSRATFTAFGMTKRVGRSAANDEVLAGVINANTPAVCLVGKTHDFHVRTALGVELEENVAAIADSISHLKGLGREPLFDAEHFFDGYKANRGYALSCLEAALEGGARWVVLCDTNGGTLPSEIHEIVTDVLRVVPGGQLGIHCHDDMGLAVAGSLAAVDAGARQVQGTLNGLGERCGNANLVSLIPTLLLKEPYRSRFETGVEEANLAKLLKTSRMLDDILNRTPNRHAPYVGAAAFTHKAGLHASAILKDPTTYEHIPPEVVGNERVVPMSNQAGLSNLRGRLADMGLDVDPKDKRLPRILESVKQREDEGFAYDGAQASFELLARRALGVLPTYFEIERYRVMVERRTNAKGERITVSEAVVSARVDGERLLSVSESHDPDTGRDQGPVNALSRAVQRDLGRYQPYVDDMKLVDFKVRITGTGTEAKTRVTIDFMDGERRRWTTVGVSENIVDASFQALHDGIIWKLVRDGAEPDRD
ncbi:citramalate synthase [Rhodovulum sp. DZ06]|uniref:citramalate synthase n=1 Tax=Rhodovulum sp. DZ06 TaxID=3425126 RepID=UPI003D32F45C